MGYFGTHLHEFGEKGVHFDVHYFTIKRGFIWVEKSVFYHEKGGSFSNEKLVFYHQKGVVLSWKVSVLLQKEDHFETGEQGWVPLFPVSKGARDEHNRWYVFFVRRLYQSWDGVHALRVLPHSNHVTSSKRAGTLICHTTMSRDPIHFLYNPGHVTFWCLQVVPVVYATLAWSCSCVEPSLAFATRPTSTHQGVTWCGL